MQSATLQDVQSYNKRQQELNVFMMLFCLT